MTTIHPVIHILTLEQALEQSRVAVGAGAASLFLIDHQGRGTEFLWEVVRSVRREFPGVSIGINHLGLGLLGCFEAIVAAVENGVLESPPAAVWCDDARDGQKGLDAAERVALFRASHSALDGSIYFGGVAFKYTRTYEGSPASGPVAMRVGVG